MKNYVGAVLGCVVVVLVGSAWPLAARASDNSYLDDTDAELPIEIQPYDGGGPRGLTPDVVRAAYNLPASSGRGTIAIIDAYDDPTIEEDLATFNKQFGLATCTTAKGCFEKHKMDATIKPNTGWAEETALDVEWAHAIAPKAKILLVEAKTASLANLLNAVDYARGRSEVVAVSMSWGSREFSSESNYDTRFASSTAVFFASSGDNGNGVSWPAVSTNVIGVGGTTLHLDGNGSVKSEVAWSGSGGGLSKYEAAPGFQIAYQVPHANGKRAVPDVSYNADPNTGYSVYTTTAPAGQKGWIVVGGTSAAAPQWAAIRAMSSTVTSDKLYKRAASSKYTSYFRDITSGSNGSCLIFCIADPQYDYVTGLGSPLRNSF